MQPKSAAFSVQTRVNPKIRFKNYPANLPKVQVLAVLPVTAAVAMNDFKFAHTFAIKPIEQH
jgi:hypothetical protein